MAESHQLAVPVPEPTEPRAQSEPVQDSASIPDGTYPARGGMVGTAGTLRPASLVRSRRTNATDNPVRDGEPEATVATHRVAEEPKIAEPSAATVVPPTPSEIVPDEPHGDHDKLDAPGVAVVPAPSESAAGALQEEQLVQLVVQEYRAAYERLDATAAKSVWPSVDDRALRHAFNQLAEQRLNFESCGVSISGNSASARCRGQAEYLPKVGTRRALVKAGEWVFDLARQDTAWHIVSARIQ